MVKAYKDYQHKRIGLPDEPEVLRVVDARAGIVYNNAAAAPGAKVIILIPRCDGFVVGI